MVESRALLARVLSHPALDGALGCLPQTVSAVGGVVRDALLEREPGPDVDLVVEGDPAPVAHQLAAHLGAELVEHPGFRTAEVRRADGHLIDLVGARVERYVEPGGLPQVAPGGLVDDLARRDFTINAIAVRLAGPDAGAIEDPLGGGKDLDAGMIRALRANTFEEDPSRLVRAARYAAQLGFALEPQTAIAARAAAPALDLGRARVLGELVRLLQEPAAAEGLARLSDLGVPWLAPRETLLEAVAATDTAAARLGQPEGLAWVLRLAAAASDDGVAESLQGQAAASARAARRGSERGRELGPRPRLSEVDDALGGLGLPGAIAGLASGCTAVAGWWARTRGRVLAIDGDDLLAAGIPPGPAIGKALARARAASLDGEAAGRGAQLRIALGVARGASE